MEHGDNGGAGEVIEIKMFGRFKLSVGEHSIEDSSMRTHQLWHLIEYLIAFRKKTISQEEIIQALWPENNIENPSNALKNLVYRIRSTFSAQKIPYAKEMIVYQGGSYQWNNSLRCAVDTEQFEGFYQQAVGEHSSQERRIGYYRKAIDLYEGEFLPGSSCESWVIPLSGYYYGLYFKCVYAVLDLLEEQGRYAEMEDVCNRALKIDKLEEMLHRYYLLSLIHQNKQSQALHHYSYISDLFFRELGVSLSGSIRDLYREIVKKTHNVVTDINIVKQDLKEPGNVGGAFYCEYEMFKNLYRLEARSAARTGQSIFISLLTIETDEEGEEALKIQVKAMDNLYTVVEGSLRKGDVFARFSATQYVLMLPMLTYENCEMVMARIIKRYRQSFRPKNISVHAKIHPLDPVEMAQ